MSEAAVSVKRGMKWGLIIALTVIGLQSFWFLQSRGLLFHSAGSLEVYGTVPSFNLTERSGQPFGSENLLGQVWIADFIFTRCAGPCPLMSSKLKQLKEELATVSGLRFVSFSVDPEYDTPERLTEYAARYTEDEKNWVFLTGDKEEIFNLSQQHFYLGAGEIPESEWESFGHRIHHSSKFVLVDREGRIRGYYDSLDGGELSKLVRDTQSLARS